VSGSGISITDPKKQKININENRVITNASVPAEFVENNTTATASGVNNAAGKMHFTHEEKICKSAPRSREITTPAPTTQFFTGRMPFLPPNQQRQSTECK